MKNLKELIEKTVKEGYLFAYAADDMPLQEAIEDGFVAKKENKAILQLIEELRGWIDMQKYDEEKTQKGKIKLYQKACNFEGWEQNHTHLYNLKEILKELES